MLSENNSALLISMKLCVFVTKSLLLGLQVIAERLSEEEIAGLKEMFKMIDIDGSGHITFEELKVGLKRFGADLNESEIHDLMRAVSISVILYCCCYRR